MPEGALFNKFLEPWIANWQKLFYSLFQDMTTAGMLRYGVSVHRQHDEAPQVCGLLSLAEGHH
jgi:hypothetical protein